MTELPRKPLSDISVNNVVNGCKRPLKSKDGWKFKTNSTLDIVEQNYEKQNALPFTFYFDNEPCPSKVKKAENVVYPKGSNSCENDTRAENVIHHPEICKDDSEKGLYTEKQNALPFAFFFDEPCPSKVKDDNVDIYERESNSCENFNIREENAIHHPEICEDDSEKDVLLLYPKWSTIEECWQPSEAQTFCDIPPMEKNRYNYSDKEPEKVDSSSSKDDQENIVCSSWPSTCNDKGENEYFVENQKWSVNYMPHKEPDEVSDNEFMATADENICFTKYGSESSLEKGSSSENPNDYLSCDFPYKEDNFAHLHTIELKYRPYPDYINFQRDITSEMRRTLVDWMIEVGLMFEYSSECIHLAISLTDRFLSVYIVSKSKLQLVGITSIFIAAKYEEVNPQELRMYSYITDSTYTKKQILQMEQKIMHILNFYIGAPIAMSFLSLIHCTTKAPEKVLFYGQYLCEVSLLDIKPFISYLPSLIGVASYFLAGSILDHNIPEEVLKMTGYIKEDFIDVMDQLNEKVHSIKGQDLQVLKKYSHPDFLCVAEVVPPKHIFI